MTIIDAYAVLAFLKGEAAAGEVEELIIAGGALTTLGVAEVIDHLVRLTGVDEEEATLDLAQLGLDDAVVIDSEAGGAAGRFRARHYHRTRCPVSLAGCVAAEVARCTRRPLATSDPALLDACHREDIAVTVLPGTDGSRWSPHARRSRRSGVPVVRWSTPMSLSVREPLATSWSPVMTTAVVWPGSGTD